MKFITMRELRNQTTQVIEELDGETGVITSNGKPVGILLGVDGDFEDTLTVLSQARASAAASGLRENARSSGAERLSAEEIDREIREVRKGRR